MNPNSGHVLIGLEPGALLRIRNARGRSVTVVRGVVWITQEGDTRDVLAVERNTFTFDRDGLALAHSLRAPAILAAEEGIIVERAPPASARGPLEIPDVSPGSRAYRRARELRAQALAHLARESLRVLRCLVRNLLHRAGLVAHPC